MRIAPRVSLWTFTTLAVIAPGLAFQGNAQQNLSANATSLKENLPTGSPQWPYPPTSIKGLPPGSDDQPHRLPGSAREYTMKEVEGNLAVDWFPDQHPKPPAGVTEGKPGVWNPCGRCHLMNGYGKPDAQSLNGMPVAYIQQQIQDIKTGARVSSVAYTRDLVHMTHVATVASDADVKAAAEYFHSIRPTKWIRVVEAETVPKTMGGVNGLWAIDPNGAKEPIGDRVLELPENYDRSLLRDPTSGFVAYVPLGSLSKGEAIVKRGAGGHTMACSTCHGNDLRGMGDTMPPIAGRSPTAMGRQLYDFKTGARHGINSAMMKPVVEKLTDEDIVNISAYLASLPQ